MPSDIHIYSIGGSGTRFLVRFFDVSELNEAHNFKPPENLDKSFFVHRDIYQSLYSLFSKKHKVVRTERRINGEWKIISNNTPITSFIKKHCRNLGGYYEKINTNWTMEEYFDNGEDLFRLHEHFDNWLKAGIPVVRLDGLIKKEIFEKLNSYLGHPASYEAFQKQFNPSKYEIGLFDKLKKLYGDLRNKLNALPDYYEP